MEVRQLQTHLPDASEILEQTAIVVARAHEITVASTEDYKTGGEFLTRIKPIRNQIEEVYGPLIKSAHEHHKTLLAAKKEHDQPLAIAESVVKGKMVTWKRAEEQRAAEEQVRLQAEAREREDEQRLAEAAELEARGRKDEAQAVVERPAMAFVPTVEAAIPHIPGVSSRKLPVKWRVVDRCKIPPMYFKTVLDEDLIDGAVKSRGLNTEIPGIETYQDETMAIGVR